MMENEMIDKKRCSCCSCMEKTGEGYYFCRILGFDYQVNDYMYSKPKGRPDWCPKAELERYRELGTVEELREVMEKQVPKKLIKDKYHFDCCPCCGQIFEPPTIYDEDWGERYVSHCPSCGQSIDLEK